MGIGNSLNILVEIHREYILGIWVLRPPTWSLIHLVTHLCEAAPFITPCGLREDLGEAELLA